MKQFMIALTLFTLPLFGKAPHTLPDPVQIFNPIDRTDLLLKDNLFLIQSTGKPFTGLSPQKGGSFQYYINGRKIPDSTTIEERDGHFYQKGKKSPYTGRFVTHEMGKNGASTTTIIHVKDGLRDGVQYESYDDHRSLYHHTALQYKKGELLLKEIHHGTKTPTLTQFFYKNNQLFQRVSWRLEKTKSGVHWLQTGTESFKNGKTF